MTRARCAPRSNASTGVIGVEAHGNELMVSTGDGPATISAVAVALVECGVPIRDLTLRTPTLDDVFLELTGSRIENETTNEGGRVMTAVTTAPTSASTTADRRSSRARRASSPTSSRSPGARCVRCPATSSR